MVGWSDNQNERREIDFAESVIRKKIIKTEMNYHNWNQNKMTNVCQFEESFLKLNKLKV